MSVEQDASLRRLSSLVDRYVHLGTHLQKCRDLLPQADPTLIDIGRVLALGHHEMRSFEHALGDLIEDSMLLHEDLRRTKFIRRNAAALATRNL